MSKLIRDYDWTQTPVGSPDQWSQSLRTTLGLLLHSALPMLLFWGDQFTCFYNDAFLNRLGEQGEHPDLGTTGNGRWSQQLNFIATPLEQVMQTAEPVVYADLQISVNTNDRLEDVYWTFGYSPVYGDEGLIDGVFVTCTETTASALNRQRLQGAGRPVSTPDGSETGNASQDPEISAVHFRHAIEQAPVAILLLKGDDLVIEMANPAMLALMDRGIESIGKPLVSIMPELSGQALLAVCRQVYRDGVPYFGWNQPALLSRNGQFQTGYFNVSYTPFIEHGQVAGVLQVVNEVTEQVLAHQKLEESEAHLQLLRDTVPAMIFYLDSEQRYQSYNEVFREWFAIDAKDAIGKTVREFLGEQAYQKALPYLAKAYAGQQVRYEMHAPSKMNVDRWLNIVYTPHLTKAGKLLGVIVHATDITLSKRAEIELRHSETRYRNLSADLEKQVTQRTKELAVANKELEASNKEYVALNEELEEANGLLMRSNNNLQQFAYVASHDLQEPLRKIQQFGDLLKTHFTDTTDLEFAYLERMQSAASRMSTLIKDLLDYSRINTQRNLTASVSLPEIINRVLSTLELVTKETGAMVNVGPLPTIQGDATQLNQLFQNLIGNALKFRRKEVAPIIQISAQTIDRSQLPVSIKPTRASGQYYRIDVADNGVGFDEKYLDRIFQVFQRLYGRSEYAGTGIGLAICEKVATNHGGAISATSKPGQGATFSVYLPVDEYPV